jgi:hypothetical protein
MKAIKSLVVAAIAAVGVAGMCDVQAAGRSGGHVRGAASGGHHGGGQWGGNHGGGHWNGNRGHWGGHGHHYRGGRYWGPSVYWGWPLGLSAAWYWGWPYYDSFYYPRAVYYVDRYAAPYPEGMLEPAPATAEVPSAPGAPTQGPLYMNYCESAKAYYPKVASCPEGWKFIAPSR